MRHAFHAEMLLAKVDIQPVEGQTFLMMPDSQFFSDIRRGLAARIQACQLSKCCRCTCSSYRVSQFALNLAGAVPGLK